MSPDPDPAAHRDPTSGPTSGPTPDPTPEDDPRREEAIRDPDAPGRGLDETDEPIPEPNEPA